MGYRMAGLLAVCMMPANTKACAERGQQYVQSTCRYSVGLARPRGSNPLSPGRDPSSHEGLSVLGSQRASAPHRTNFFCHGNHLLQACSRK